MISNNIYLVNNHDHFFLIDNHKFKPVALSKKAFEALSAYKSGTEISKLKEDFGSEFVDKVLNEIKSLIEKNIISDSNIDTYMETKNRISDLAKKELSFLEGVFMISQNCNMACKYCYGGEAGNFNSRGLMSRQMAEDFLHFFLSRGGDRPYQKIVFLGGEPLLNFEVIKYVIELWEKLEPKYNGRKLVFTLTTNGTLLTSEIVEYFKKKGIIISISLDGPKDVHDGNRVFKDGQGTYDKVMEGIELLRKYDMPLYIRSTVCGNIELDKCIQFFKEKSYEKVDLSSVDYPALHPVKDYQMDLNAFRNLTKKGVELIQSGCKNITGDKNDNFDNFEAKQMTNAFANSHVMKEDMPYLCGAGNWYVTFGMDGYIYPCQRFVGKEIFRIGDVKQGIYMEKLISFYNRFLEASRSCDSCWAINICGRKCFFQKSTEDGGFEPLSEDVCNTYRDCYFDSIISTKKFVDHMKDKKTNMDELFGKYNADRATDEYLKKMETRHE